MRDHMDTIAWELRPVKHISPTGPRQAAFYTVKYQETTYQVMLGINEQGRYLLLEHLVKDDTKPHGYPYRSLPYLRERAQSGKGLLQFETFEQVKVFLNEQIRTWEGIQHEH
jgi:hypothetical protein